jgi:hypothetical protein
MPNGTKVLFITLLFGIGVGYFQEISKSDWSCSTSNYRYCVSIFRRLFRAVFPYVKEMDRSVNRRKELGVLKHRFLSSVADPGCLSRIGIFSIQDLHQRI